MAFMKVEKGKRIISSKELYFPVFFFFLQHGRSSLDACCYQLCLCRFFFLKQRILFFILNTCTTVPFHALQHFSLGNECVIFWKCQRSRSDLPPRRHLQRAGTLALCNRVAVLLWSFIIWFDLIWFSVCVVLMNQWSQWLFPFLSAWSRCCWWKSFGIGRTVYYC